jgi:uncharacterized membrane protein YsdA (DUF1294 family)
MSAPPPLKRESPTAIFALVAAVVVTGTLYGGWRLSVAVWMGYLAGINLAAFLLYGYDKAVAGGAKLRVPESVLQGIALLGGSPAAFLSQRLFRHKTVKEPFQRAFRLIIAAQILILGLAMWVRVHPPAWLPEGIRQVLSGR